MSILTEREAATVLRCEETDQAMLDLLPAIDRHIERVTGRDWALDTPIDPLAKAAARMLLVRLYEDPGGMAAGNALAFGLPAALVQLQDLAREFKALEEAEAAE